MSWSRPGHVPVASRWEEQCACVSTTSSFVSEGGQGHLADVVDFLQGWLNYQIEHHLWPDLSMLSYQKAQPLVRDICKRYGVPYIQESVWVRLVKTISVIGGRSSMRRFPAEYNSPRDMIQ